ncbi:hypothetical protein GQ457_01G021380 [Hibiscus cannabinus]
MLLQSKLNHLNPKISLHLYLKLNLLLQPKLNHLNPKMRLHLHHTLNLLLQPKLNHLNPKMNLHLYPKLTHQILSTLVLLVNLNLVLRIFKTHFEEEGDASEIRIPGFMWTTYPTLCKLDKAHLYVQKIFNMLWVGIPCNHTILAILMIEKRHESYTDDCYKKRTKT